MWLILLQQFPDPVVIRLENYGWLDIVVQLSQALFYVPLKLFRSVFCDCNELWGQAQVVREEPGKAYGIPGVRYDAELLVGEREDVGLAEFDEIHPELFLLVRD